jgi:hypothetical protein
MRITTLLTFSRLTIMLSFPHQKNEPKEGFSFFFKIRIVHLQYNTPVLCFLPPSASTGRRRAAQRRERGV